MRQPVSDFDDSEQPGFQKVVDGFLLQPGLPFATVVTAEKINGIFAKHGGLFGGNDIYSSAIVLWAFLGQVLRDGKEASCQSAVAGIISFCLQVGRDAPTSDTGDYCRARAKLSEPALRELSTEIANEAEQQADAAWLWKGRHTKLIRYAIVEKGKRTKSITVVTTMTDIGVYTKEDIAELYGHRWSSELDIRSIKDSLNPGHVRCKSPEMVRIEFRTTFLAYNLIRLTGASAAIRSKQKPRTISFTSTCQFVLSGWAVHASGLMSQEALRKECNELLKRIAECRVGDRAGRLEPRVIKRRRHGYPLMQKPRHVLRAELRKHCT